MQKNYSKKKRITSTITIQPKTETINFLINYSKSLCVIELKSEKIELSLN